MAAWLGGMAKGYERMVRREERRAWSLPAGLRAMARGGKMLRLRGGNGALEDLPLMSDKFDEKELQEIHAAGSMDNMWERKIEETMLSAGNQSQYETLIDPQGLFDGFPSDWRRWKLKETHVGLLVPKDFTYSRSLHNNFDSNEMAVIIRNDGSKRFCKVVACDDDGALRNGEEVGKSYVVKLENDEKTNKVRELQLGEGSLGLDAASSSPDVSWQGITRVERADNIGKISPATLEEEHVLDETCRTEAAIALKNMGNDALNMSLYDVLSSSQDPHIA